MLNNVDVATSHRLAEIEGDFPMDEAVFEGREIPYLL